MAIIGQDRQADARQLKYPFLDSCSCKIGTSIFGPNFIQQLVFYMPCYAKPPMRLTALTWSPDQKINIAFSDALNTFTVNAQVTHATTVYPLLTPDRQLAGLLRVSNTFCAALTPALRVFYQGKFEPAADDFIVTWQCCRQAAAFGVRGFSLQDTSTRASLSVQLENNLYMDTQQLPATGSQQDQQASRSAHAFNAYCYLPKRPASGITQVTVVDGQVSTTEVCEGKHLYVNNEIKSDLRVATKNNIIQIGSTRDF